MRTKLFPAAAMLCALYASSAFARIGETEAQIAKRYGQPKESLKQSAGFTSRAYIFQTFDVIVSFEGGVSCGESYMHSNRMPLLEPEIATLLQANAGNGTWKVASNSGFTTIYKNTDRVRVASYEGLDRKLLVTTQAFIDRVSSRHQQEIKKGF
jgi:hypothetical protein